MASQEFENNIEVHEKFTIGCKLDLTLKLQPRISYSFSPMDSDLMFKIKWHFMDIGI